MKSSTAFTKTLGIKYPIIQSPMAGVSTPKLAATISNCGGLGSLPFGSSPKLEDVKKSVVQFHQFLDDKTLSRNVNLNFFVFKNDPHNEMFEQINQDWIKYFTPLFNKFGADPPQQLINLYSSFDEVIDQQNPNQDNLLKYIVDEVKPKIISFHFGIPATKIVKFLQSHDILVFASATSTDEADFLIDNGINGLIAQGYEAGGHRGNFLSDENSDTNLQTEELTTQLITHLKKRGLSDSIFIVAAGGIMTNQSVKHFLQLGSSAVQIGTAFILSPDCTSGKDFHKLSKTNGINTVMTSKISGKPARAIETGFVKKLIQDSFSLATPQYPYAYDIYKQLNSLAVKNGDHEYGAYLAGSGVSLVKKATTTEIFKDLSSGVGGYSVNL